MASLADALAKSIGVNATHQEVSMWVDSGFPPLNKAISGSYFKGFPCGRIIEIFGPPSSGKTAIATNAMISAQKKGGVAMYNDHERSFDSGLAESLGLDLDPNKWIFKTPETFEKSISDSMTAAEIIREGKFIDPTSPIVIVYDSLASMVPKSKFEKDGKKRGVDEYNMNDNTALARATSAVFPALVQWCEKYNICMIFLNQARTKIGVMYGDPTCLHGNVIVPFVDGTSATMREIVKNKINKEVWSFNEETGKFEAKMIVGWHNNGCIPNDNDWIHIETKGLHTRNGRAGFAATPDHRIMTAAGEWVSAADLKIGDKLVTKRVTRLNGTLEQFLRFAMSGDAHILRGNNRNGASLRIQDNNDPEYMRWKVAKLSPFFEFSKGATKNGEYEFWTTKRAYEDIGLVNKELRGCRSPIQALTTLSPIGMALWIMDDGYYDESHKRYSLSVKRFARSPDLSEVADRLFDLGFDFGVRRGEGRFDFTVESSRKLAELICEFVPPCMNRKLPEDLRDRYVDYNLECEEVTKIEESEILKIRSLGKKSAKQDHNRYDITVEDNHNYMVGNSKNGVIVHNCTPGGGAPEYYASVRIKLGKSMISAGTGEQKETVGQQVGAQCVKNKVNRPFQKATWNFMFREDGSGYFDVVGSMVDYLVKIGKIDQSGPRISWDGKSYFRSQLIAKIEEDGLYPELLKLLPDDSEDVVEPEETSKEEE